MAPSKRELVVPCVICGHGHLRDLWRVNIDRRGPSISFLQDLFGEAIPEINVLRCDTCLSFRQQPILSDEIYNMWYLSPLYAFERGQGYEGPSGEKLAHARKVLRLISQATQLPMGRILDVGCNDGVFLSVCKAAGWETLGCEVSPRFAARALETFDIPVVVGSYLDLTPEIGPFDVVTFWDVFEHFADPNYVLERARLLLSRTGWVALEVPNAGSLFRKILGKNWWFGFEHIFYYTPEGLIDLLKRNGFRPVRIETDNVNLLRREGLVRLGFYGADAVWGRGGAANRAKEESRSSGLVSSCRHAMNRYLNTFFNNRLLGDQLRVVAQKV